LLPRRSWKTALRKHSSNSSATARAAGKALGGIFSALVLEADLATDALTERKLRAMLGTSFDALLGLGIKEKT
jgi:hypothetical protein